jgi:predicted dienelactone hydrolase
MAVTGHSFGGYTALAVSGAQLNFDALEQWCDDSQSREDAFDPDRMSYTVCFMRGSAAVVAEARGLDAPPQGAWPATTDSRVKAVVAMAPWNGPILGGGGLDHVAVPVMILVGSADSVTPPERDAYAIYNQIASEERTLVTFENADHYIFVDSCWELAIRLGFFDRCSDQVWDMARVHDLTNHFATSFLLSVLYGDAAARQALAPDAIDFRGVEYVASE